MKQELSHPEWAMRAKAALITCGLIFFGCGGIAVDDSLDSGDASDEYQRDVVTRDEPDESAPDVDVWLSDDIAEGTQPGADALQPGAEGTPCDCPAAEYGIALRNADETIVFDQPLDEPWLAARCGLPSAIFDACGVPSIVGACHESKGCVLFVQDALSPTLYRYDRQDGPVTELVGDLDLTVNTQGSSVFGVLEFKTSTAVYQGSYRVCATARSVCAP